jgi:hypothetical protein
MSRHLWGTTNPMMRPAATGELESKQAIYKFMHGALTKAGRYRHRPVALTRDAPPWPLFSLWQLAHRVDLKH